jgi:auxin-responsive protein IAA
MENSEKSEALPQLLDLIPAGKEWKERDAQGTGRSRNKGFRSEDDERLELKLGLPGLIEEEIKAVSRDEGLQQDRPALSLGYFHKPSKAATSTTTTGTKRGFLDTVEIKTEGN